MGYSFDKEMHVGDSDTACDFLAEITDAIIPLLKEQEKVKENTFNTDGILNVAMTLQDFFNLKDFNYYPIGDYAKEFVVRFKKWIQQQKQDQWDDESNKREHLAAYNKILKNLQRSLKGT